MAATETPTKPEKMVSLSKSVQEISMDGDEPPPPYIVRDSPFGPIQTCPPLGSIPAVDLSLFSESSYSLHFSREEVENELEKLRSALASWGCFQVKISLKAVFGCWICGEKGKR